MEEQQRYGGQIGTNIPSSRQENEENILKTMYRWYLEDQEITVAELCKAFSLSRHQWVYYMQSLEKHGYIEKDPGGEILFLTSYGISQGQECERRHRNLTQFLRRLGVSEAHAEEDACRMEHIISTEVIDSIYHFMNSGEVYDCIIRDTNLYYLFPEGTYRFQMGIYEIGKTIPRIIAREEKLFQSEIVLKVREESSSFFLKPMEAQAPASLRYQGKTGFIQAALCEEGWEIPTGAFTFTEGVSREQLDGSVIITFCEESNPSESQCRMLDVHLWKL